jgi:hypothetical protein
MPSEPTNIESAQPNRSSTLRSPLPALGSQASPDALRQYYLNGIPQWRLAPLGGNVSGGVTAQGTPGPKGTTTTVAGATTSSGASYVWKGEWSSGITFSNPSFSVVGTSSPWEVNGTLNSSFNVSGIYPSTGTAPISISVTPGQVVSIQYVSGTVTAGPGFGYYDANGGTSVINNQLNQGRNASITGKYIPGTFNFNANGLIGAFATATGQVITPINIGNTASVVAPAGATQLLLGTNDGTNWSDDLGTWVVNIQVYTQVQYNFNDIVYWEGNLYLCIQSNTSNDIFVTNTAYWKLIDDVSDAFYVYFPENYGAIGNGSHDDTVGIQGAINAAAAAGGGTVLFGPKTYLTSASLNITSSNVCLAGVTSGSSTIMCNSASVDILKITGTGTFGASTNLYYNKIQDIRLSRNTSPTSTASGIHFSLVNGTKLYRVECFDSVYGFWQDANNAFIQYQQCQAAWTATTTSGTVYGWYMDGGNHGFYSSRLLDCFVINSIGGGASTSYGMYMTGAYVADLFCEGFETTTCTYGVYVNATSAGGGLSAYNNDDIHFLRCIHDIVGNSAYSIQNLNGGNSYLEILGGYVTAASGNTNSLVNITNSNGVLVSGVNFRCTNGVYLYGTTTGAVIKGNSFYCLTNNSMNTAMILVLTNNNIVIGNTIYGYSGYAFYDGIYCDASYNSINDNTIGGYGTNGIILDTSSSNNSVLGNSIDTTHLTTGLSNLGSGNMILGTPGISSIGPVLLEEHTANNTGAALGFTNWYSANYDEYIIEVVNLIPASNCNIGFQASTNGGGSYDGGNNYNWSSWFVASGASAVEGAQPGSYIALALAVSATTSLGGLSGFFRLFGPGSTTFNKLITGQSTSASTGNSNNYSMQSMSGAYLSTTAVNAFQVVTTTGNLVSGTVRIYGVGH